jgi:arsenate reductase
MITLYGIPNCDSMKKARKWLKEHALAYEFHDYKKLGIDEALLCDWIARASWEVLLNRRGMMWRKLTQDQRDNINEANAIEIMLSTPSIIKRPVLVMDDLMLVGFDETKYKELI